MRFLLFTCVFAQTLFKPLLAKGESFPNKQGASLLQNDNGSINEIRVSKGDERLYRSISLENDLQVLLISDPLTNNAAAAMDVRSGTFSDPEEVGGLAHFLEHMLFLGTNKYPKEDSYDQFLSARGGQFNAYTAQEHTNFHFAIPPEHLEQTLDHFAQFFISPLLSISATKREMHAVDSEHSKNLQDDSWRLHRLTEYLANETCPYHNFGTGCLKTLGRYDDDTLHQLLYQMWSKYFVASNMCLVILGRESLDELQNFAKSIFSSVPMGPKASLVGHEVFNEKNVYPQLGSKILYKPVKEIRRLYVTFPLPPQLPSYRLKSLAFLRSMLSSAGPESLTQSLKHRGWISSSGQADVGIDTNFFSLFSWSFDLTLAGFDHIDEIVQSFFSYLALIKNEGLSKWRYEELQILAQMQFDHKSKESPMSYVSDLARTMHHVDTVNDVLAFDYLYEGFQPRTLRALITNYLKPENMIMYIVTPNHEEQALTSREPWYDFSFGIQTLSPKTLRFYSQAFPSKLQLPPRNNYIPKNLSLRAPPKNRADVPLLEQKPVIIQETVDPAVRLWFHQDTTFRVPKLRFQVKMWSPVPHSSPRAFLLTNLYLALYDEVMEQMTILPGLAGFRYSSSLGLLGVTFSLEGWSDFEKFVRYVELVFSNLNPKLPPQFTQMRFNAVKNDLLKSYRNLAYQKPYEYTKRLMNSILLPRTEYHPRVLVKMLLSLELSDVIQFQKFIFSDVQLECLAFGNLIDKEATQILSVVLKSFPFQTVSFDDSTLGRSRLVRPRMVRLQKEKYEIKTQLENPREKNSAVLQYYQIGWSDLVAEVHAQLLSQICEKPLYHQLRTLEQLGYIVWSYQTVQANVIGFSIEVMSSVHDAAYLAQRIDAFIPQLRQYVLSLHAPNREMRLSESFQTYVDSLYSILIQNYTTMGQQCGAFWDQIVSEQLWFSKKLEMAQVLRDPSLVNMTSLARAFDHTFGHRTGIVSLQVDPKKPDTVLEVTPSSKRMMTATTAVAEEVVIPVDSALSISKNGEITKLTFGSVCSWGDQLPLFPAPPRTPLPEVIGLSQAL